MGKLGYYGENKYEWGRFQYHRKEEVNYNF